MLNNDDAWCRLSWMKKKKNFLFIFTEFETNLKFKFSSSSSSSSRWHTIVWTIVENKLNRYDQCKMYDNRFSFKRIHSRRKNDGSMIFFYWNFVHFHFFSHSQFWNNILLCLYIGCFQESCEPEILYIEFGKTKTKTKHWYIDTLLNDQMAKIILNY